MVLLSHDTGHGKTEFAFRHHPLKPFLHALLAMLLVFTAGRYVFADDDHERALDLREHGQILPLARLLDRLTESHPGRILKVELEEKGHSIVYEIELLGENGSVREIIIDAKNGKILLIEDD